MQEYVVGFLFSEDWDKVVLIRKNRPSWQAGKLNGVGGKIEQGELPIQTMVREFEEETTAHITNWKRFSTLTDNDTYIVHFFVAENDNIYQCQSNTDEIVEISDTMFFYLNDRVPNLYWLLPMALNSLASKENTVYRIWDCYYE